MLTSEVREWMKKVERKQYSYEDALDEFVRISSFLTKEEILQLQKRLKDYSNR